MSFLDLRYVRPLFWLLCLILPLALWAEFSQALLAAPQTPDDAVVTDCSNDTQLRNAVLAGGTTTVTFNCGAGAHTIPISAYMQASGTITIDGADQITLDGGDTTAFFQVLNGSSLTLQRLTLRRGKFTGVYPLENFGTLRLINIRVRDHTSTADSGVIVNYGDLTVKDSRITNNTLSNPNGAAGAGIVNEGGTAEVENSTFISNTITGGLGTGGAIAVRSGNLTVISSTFDFNGALDGGAIFVNSGTVVTVTQSLFVNNRAGYGGAIESRGQLDLNYSTLKHNQATGGDGGAIWVLESDLDMAYSTVSDNQAGTTGGGISCYDNTLSVIHSTISGNQAGTTGGGVYSSCNLNLTNSTLSANHAPNGSGGAVYQTGAGSATVAAVTVAGNTAQSGAGVYNDNNGGSSLTLQYTLLAGNTTGNCDGGGITSQGYNLADDNNCGALTQTGDQKNVALPLRPLADNGGPTLTHLPSAGNPAIDAIPAAQCGFSTDQRDVARPANGLCDIGAVEVSAPNLTVFLPLVRR
jgi:hypothetical protein